MNINFNSEILVSFLIPTYNRADLLQQCIESILSQTYKNVEIIVIDDASTDNTENVINSKFKGRVKYYKNNVNRGVAYSRNRGLTYANGKYIGLLDSDDLLLEPHCVEMALEVLESNSGIGVFTSDAYCLDLKGNKVYEKTFFQTVIDHRDVALSSGIKDFEYVFSHGIHSCGAIFTKDITKDIGFLNPDYKIAWDEDFFLRVAAHRPDSVYYYNKPLTGYRHHGGNISNNAAMLYSEKIACRQAVLRKNKNLQKQLSFRANKRLAEQCLYLVDAYLKEGDIAKATASVFRSLFFYPLIFPALFKHGFNFSVKLCRQGAK